MERLSVDVYQNLGREDFQEKVYSKAFPAVVRNVDIGNCLQKWTVDYLSERLRGVQIPVHCSRESRLNFVDKNFKYKTLPFDEFIERASSAGDGEMLYLRSIGTDRRGRDVADLNTHFPQIAGDFELPLFVPCSEDAGDELFFSSVLRISSPQLSLWTHYDIMDNILVQVKGKKRVVLFHPQDVPFLYMVGDKSRVTDIDAPPEVMIKEYPLFLEAKRYEVVLEPGDVLFIPSLWFHNIKSLTFSVGVNVFWRDRLVMDLNLYDKNDAYGNKDLIPASSAFANLDKALKHLEKLPEKYRKFYIRMMMSRLTEKL